MIWYLFRFIISINKKSKIIFIIILKKLLKFLIFKFKIYLTFILFTGDCKFFLFNL